MLARMHAGAADTFVDLRTATGACRDSLARALAALRDDTYLAPPPRARGAWSLTPRGRSAAPACVELLAARPVPPATDVALHKWTLPVVVALSGWSLRFSDLRASVPGVTPRALVQALDRMTAAGLVTRAPLGGFPPVLAYGLTPAGEALVPTTRALAAAVARPG